MKKIVSIILTLTIIFSSTLIGVFNFMISAATESDYSYTVSNDKSTIISVNSSISGDITIPSTLGGYPVVNIDDNAFLNCKSLTSVIIPNSVISIGDHAFYNCSSLTSVNIPDSVISIGEDAFHHCKNLTSVSIGNNVTSIGNRAFRYCELLTNVIIPDTVTSIGEDAFAICDSLTKISIGNNVTSIDNRAFYHCSSLTSVNIPDSLISIGIDAFNGCESVKLFSVSADNPNYSSVSGVLFNKEKTILMYYPAAKPTTSYTILDGVTKIDNYAFSNCSSLASIDIPDSVISIGDYAFSNCSSLTSINIPDSVTSIGDTAFGGCSKLESVYITDLKSWCNIIFDGGNFLNGQSNPLNLAKKLYLNNNLVTKLVIPDGVTSIGDYTFVNCDSLISVTIPDSVTSIGSQAFRHCELLTSVIIPDSVTSIGKEAFGNCSSLTSIDIPDSVISISEQAFRDCSSLKKVNISDSVNRISDYAFLNCKNLTSVSVGKNVRIIDYGAFEGCYNLEIVYYRGSEADKEKIQIDKENSRLDNAIWYYNSCIADSEHTYDSKNDFICNVCGFKITEVHPYITYTENENGAVVTGFKDVVIGELVIPDTLNGAPVITIESMAFMYCEGITDVIIPDSVTDIKEYAFFGCTLLENVTLGSGVKSVGTEAFADCSALKKVYYCGTNSDWDKISIGSYNTALTDAIRIYHNYSSTTTSPTCTEKGFTTYTCSICGKSYSDEIYALGHDYSEEFIIDKEATDFENGSKSRHCSRCDSVTDVTVIPAAPQIESISGNTVRMVAVSGYEYSIDGVNWQSNNIFTNLEENKIYSAFVRTIPNDIIINPTPSTPTKFIIVSAPKIKLIGATKLVVEYIEGYEYSIDGVVWQSSNIFTDLIPEFDYVVYQRYTGSDLYSSESEGTEFITNGQDEVDINPDATNLVALRHDLLNGSTNNMAYDYNADGEVDARDLVRLKKYLAGIDVPLGTNQKETPSVELLSQPAYIETKDCILYC